MMGLAGKERKSIVIIVQNLPVPFDRRVWQEAMSLRKNGYHVSVICPKKKMYTKSFEVLEGIEIYRYALPYEASQGVLGYFFEFAYCWIVTLWISIKIYRKRSFQIIHACNPPDTYFALAALYKPLGVKFIFDHHDLSPEMFLAKGNSKSSILYKGLKLLEWLTFKLSDLVIAVNESHKEIAVNRGGIDSSKIIIVRSGPTQAWAELDSYNDSLKKGKKFLVVYLGEMCPQDGVDYLLKAIQHYQTHYPKDTMFVLIGGGPDQERMRNMAADLDLKTDVLFTGRIPDEELWQYLSTADLCVDPDPYTEWSNLSTMNKIIEYMAFGRPIVAFDLKENRRSAQKAGLFIDRNDYVKFSEGIRSLLLNPELRSKMSNFGKDRFIESLAWEKSSKMLISGYDSLFQLSSKNEVQKPNSKILAKTSDYQ